MKSYPNIDRSLFRPGEFVGYGRGVIWRVRRSGWEWQATSGAGVVLFARTLGGLSRQLSGEAQLRPLGPALPGEARQ